MYRCLDRLKRPAPAELACGSPPSGRTTALLELWSFADTQGLTTCWRTVFDRRYNAEHIMEESSDMRVLGVSDASSENFAGALQRCSRFPEASRIHHWIVKNGLEHLTVLANHIVCAYDKCGSLRDARRVFDTTVEKNLFSWNITIAAHAHNDDFSGAIQLFSSMFLQGLSPNEVTYVVVLHACTNSELWEEAKLIHALIIDGTFVPCDVENAIFSMYSKCGSLKDSLCVFDRMESHNEVSWNALIAACALAGGFADSFQYFKQMILEGIFPGRATYMTLLNALDENSGVGVGRTIHAQYLSSDLESDVVLNTAFLNMYRKYGSLTDGCTLFNSMPQRNLVSWNVMLAMYVQHRDPQEALALFTHMLSQQVMPDGRTFVTILNTCTSPRVLNHGEIIYDIIIRCSWDSDALVGSSLVSMYGKCGSLVEARTLLGRLSDNHMVAWNAMLTGYAQQELANEALELFGEMRARGIMPDRVTFISVIRSCSKLNAIERGIQVHVSVKETSFNQNTAVVNALITMYGKCKEIGYARKAFKEMLHHDLISWNALIVGYAHHEDVEEIVKTLSEMLRLGLKPNKATYVSALDACCSSAALVGGQMIHHLVVDLGFEADVMTGTALITMYGKCGHLEGSRSVFDQMPKHDVISWSAMIATYGQKGCGKKALYLFQEMASGGLMPNRVTYVSVIDACANIAALPEGKLIHTCFMESEVNLDVVVGNAFISMYGKCGSLENARYMFNRLQHKDVVSWSALIAAFAQHGHGKEAVSIFREMDKHGMKPDSITLVSVLSACSHAGLIADACSYFDTMEEEYGIVATEDHYVCMIDLFGRIGRLKEAEKYLMKIPGKPGIVAWMTLLSACRLHDDLDKGQFAAEKVLELDPLNDAVYVILSNILSSAGKWSDASRLRTIMAQRGVKKSLGWSSITLDGQVHEFSVVDTSHPKKQEIQAELEKMTLEIKRMGYVPETKYALHDVAEERKEKLLCHHSERLAIAFGLISTCHATPLHIIKNLRVCGDCHTATKYISKLTKRVITVRDANRFHHFKDGICSCGDFW